MNKINGICNKKGTTVIAVRASMKLVF